MTKMNDLTGQRVGWLDVLYRDTTKTKRVFWICVCDREGCGRVKSIRGSRLSLREKPTQSCGCYQRDGLGDRRRTHGQSNNPLYYIWLAMMHRCYRAAESSYPDYGGRGIDVCKRWRESVTCFIGDVSPRPEGLEINRLNNDAGYWCGRAECEECAARGGVCNWEWTTRKLNCNNTRWNVRVSYAGETRTTAQWFDEYPNSCDRYRYLRSQGRSEEEALRTAIETIYGSPPTTSIGG